MDDYDELFNAFSDPNKVDFDGSIDNVLTFNGDSFINGDNWITEEPSAICYDRAGRLMYQINVDTAGTYRLQINCSQLYPNSSFNNFAFNLSVDNVRVGAGICDNLGHIYFYLPQLTKGQHTLAISWENQTKQRILSVDTLALQILGGPDTDGNGIPDWVDARLQKAATLSMPITSFISPVCAEGVIATDVLDITFEGFDADTPIARKTLGKNYYVNIPLKSEGISEYAVNFHNVERTDIIQCEWLASNISECNDSVVTIRQNDAMLFNLNTVGSITYNGNDYNVSPDTPAKICFESVGTYFVTGSDGARMKIKVVSGKFSVSPTIVVGKIREWKNTQLESYVSLESENPLAIRLISPYNLEYSTIRLSSNKAGGFTVVSRVSPGGAISDVTTVNAIDGSFDDTGKTELVRTFPDGTLLVQSQFILSHFPPHFKLKFVVFVEGIMFEDGSISKEFTAADFDENGVLIYRMLVTPDATTGACHYLQYIQVNQDGTEELIYSAR